VNIAIMRAFVTHREILATHHQLAKRLEQLRADSIDTMLRFRKYSKPFARCSNQSPTRASAASDFQPERRPT